MLVRSVAPELSWLKKAGEPQDVEIENGLRRLIA
jgi:hypothetical protein